jgi:hypothetical protein
MEFKRSGFVYQVAYGLRSPDNYPMQTNLCRLFWRFVLMLFPWVFLVCFSVVFAIVSYSYGVFFASKPTIFDFTEDREKRASNAAFVPYKHWPTVAGKRIYPIWVIAAAYVIHALLTTDVADSVGHSVGNVVSLMADYFPIVFSVIGLTIIVVYTIGTIRKSEWLTLVKGYIKAKKEKVCPIVRFVD